MDHPAIDVRLMISDERWPAYRESLEERRRTRVFDLSHKHFDYPTMCRLAGEIASLDYALGLPDELLKLDPTSDLASP